MKIYLASDHAGFELKEKTKQYLEEQGNQPEDCGAFSFDKDDDYPDFIEKAARKVSEDESNIGILFGGSGQGEEMTANKIKGVRCALFYAPSAPIEAVDIDGKESLDPFEIVKLAREHNHANILSIAARFLSEEDVIKAITVFLNTPFSNEERHIRRIEKIKKLEEAL